MRSCLAWYSRRILRVCLASRPSSMNAARAACVGVEECQSVTYLAARRASCSEMGATTTPSRSAGNMALEKVPT
nr:hypothetical protein [Actinomadura sp. HBU206391]